MPEFFDWPPSERYGDLRRNDGRSVHHRNELEKMFMEISSKIEALKYRDPSTSLGMTEGKAGMTEGEAGMTEGEAGTTDEVGGS